MTKKKRTKHVLRPWCWYCEREFEDEKVLMQHQKAKHFKCGHCPRKLNTAGGLAVHIQQVHKLDPEPIENAINGRNGYDVEIFGMEGVPAADMAAYKRKKELELGLPPGTFGHAPGAKPHSKRTFENRVYTYDELTIALERHKNLMGRNEDAMDTGPDISGPVLHAAPTVYAVPPPMPGMPPPLPFPPPGLGFPPPPIPGMPPFMPPGPFGSASGPAPPFPPPGMLPPPHFLPQQFPPQNPPETSAFASLPPPSAASRPPPNVPTSFAPKKSMIGSRSATAAFDPVAAGLKEGTVLEWTDLANSPLERRAQDPKYSQGGDTEMLDGTSSSDNKGRKRARAEDFLD